MNVSSPNIVSLLLEHGADPYECDISGNDSFMYASTFGRTDNVKFWLKRFPDWDLERKNKVAGGVARSGYGDGSDSYDSVQAQVHDKGQGLGVDAEAYVFLD